MRGGTLRFTLWRPGPASPRSARCGQALLVVIASLATASAARAQQTNHRQKFDLFVEGGGSFYTPKSTSRVIGFTSPLFGPIVARETVTLQDSGRLFAGGDFWFTRHDAIQVSYSYSLADVAQATAPIDPPISGGAAFFVGRRHDLSFDYVHSFSLSHRWRFLLASGIGADWWRNSFDGTVITGFAANVGAAASFRLTEHWAVRGEYRVYISQVPSSGFVGGTTYDHVPTLGIVFRF
jgi:hypothetical protein